MPRHRRYDAGMPSNWPSVGTMGREIALVDRTGAVAPAELADVAAALTEQVHRHFAPFWRAEGTVRVCPVAPPDAWSVTLTEGVPGVGSGFHAHARSRPFALVDIHAGRWTVTASHELLEMLADPWRERLQIAPAPPGWPQCSPLVHYLLQVCDPCQRPSYEIQGIAVSDFLLPCFYDGHPRTVGRCSYAGSLTHPRRVGEGGYLAFINPADGHVWQRHVHDGEMSDVDWGLARVHAATQGTSNPACGCER